MHRVPILWVMKAPAREPLTVGLNRNRKRRAITLPPWIEEHFGWMTMLIAVCSVGLVTYLLNPSGELVRPTRKDQQAHLAVVMGPMKRWAPGSEENLLAMKMSVKNLGPATAENVLVRGLSKDTVLHLKGPKELKVNEQAEYVLESAVTLTRGASVVAQYLCWNCPLTPGPSPAESQELVGFSKEQAILEGRAGH